MKSVGSLVRLEAAATGTIALVTIVGGILATRVLDAGPADASSARIIRVMAIAIIVVAGGTIRMLIRQLTAGTSAAARRLGTVSADLEVATRQQSTTVQRHYQSMVEITTTIRELLATSQQIAEAAQRTAQLSTDAAASSRTGDHRVTSTHEALTRIRDHVGSIVDHMKTLEARSQQVKGILDIINELADQTNILSLNATIEAVSAGSFGSRFAVIADEIRKLSDRVAGSTRDIRQLLDQINSAVTSTLGATEAGAESVELGTERFNETIIAFHSIAAFVDSARDEARDIELSTKQQASAMDQLHHAIDEISRSGRDIESSIEQAQRAITELGAVTVALGNPSPGRRVEGSDSP